MELVGEVSADGLNQLEGPLYRVLGRSDLLQMREYRN